MPTIAGVKALPWLKILAGLAAFLLVYLILSMFRYEVLPSQSGLFGGSDKHAVLDRWTGKVVIYPDADDETQLPQADTDA